MDNETGITGDCPRGQPRHLAMNMTDPTRSEPRSILMVAGETSADRYGAGLVRKLRALRAGQELSFFGTGGDEMEASGVELLCHIRNLHGIGLREALHHLRGYFQTFRLLTATCRQRRPAVAVLLDFPEFNLPFAKRLKRLGIKVIYYISPQLWAWRHGRIRIIRRYVDQMLVILPFEEEYYKVRGVHVEFVGHPLLENFETEGDRASFLAGLDLDPAAKTIAVLPGSRGDEVKYILPTFLEAAKLVARRLPVQLLISVAPAINPQLIAGIASKVLGERVGGQGYRIVSAPARTILLNSDFGFVKCGTSTLEAALVGTPFLITYKVSTLNWHVFNNLVRTQYKGLVNLIAKMEIVPEFLQRDATPEALARTALEYLEKPEKAAEMRDRLGEIRKMLGSRCASDITAARVAEYLELKAC
jgi:lipid-A-disaccharide synthase